MKKVHNQKKELAIGDWEVNTQKEGLNEAFIESIKEGQTFYTVRIKKDLYIDVLRQEEAVIISLLTQIRMRI